MIGSGSHDDEGRSTRRPSRLRQIGTSVPERKIPYVHSLETLWSIRWSPRRSQLTDRFLTASVRVARKHLGFRAPASRFC